MGGLDLGDGRRPQVHRRPVHRVADEKRPDGDQLVPSLVLRQEPTEEPLGFVDGIRLELTDNEKAVAWHVKKKIGKKRDNCGNENANLNE